MNISKGFYDLSISESCATSSAFNSFLCRIYEMGYRTIAINQILNEERLEPKKKKKKGEPRESNDVVPIPVKINYNKEDCKDLKILNRLTISFTNQDIIHKVIKSVNLKKFDILAALPMSQNAVQFACSQMDIDLICFDSETKLPYKIKRKLYNQAVERNIYFEILYSPAILDSTHRKNIIQVSHLYHAVGKSKNILLSSGSVNKMQVRSPYDIIFLGLLFGLNASKAKEAITESGRNVVIHSIGRRHGKSIMFVEDPKISTDESSEGDEMETDEPAQKKSKQ